MRLIDADELINILEWNKGREKDALVSINSLIKLIGERPTAYDVDKVIEEIEEWTARVNVINDNSGKVGQVDVIGSNKAIKIVEGGGIKK